MSGGSYTPDQYTVAVLRNALHLASEASPERAGEIARDYVNRSRGMFDHDGLDAYRARMNAGEAPLDVLQEALKVFSDKAGLTFDRVDQEPDFSA